MINSTSFDNWNDFIPDICIYHSFNEYAPCPDGIASAWVVYKRFMSVNPLMKFKGMNYNEIQDFNWGKFSNQKIIIVDFSIPFSLVNQLENKGNQVIIIDHHKSFYDDFKEYFSNQKIYSFDNFKFDEKVCGALACWELFFPCDLPPTFLLYVNDRDLFKKQLPFTDEIHLSMGSGSNKEYPKFKREFGHFDQMVFDEIEFGWDYVKSYLFPIGEYYKKSREEKILKILNNPKKFIHWDEVPIVFLNSSEMSLKSDISEYVQLNLEKSEDYFFVVIINKKDLSRVKVKTILEIDLLSLFSDLDATGHSTACGFPWLEGDMDELKELVVQKYWQCF